MSPSSSCGRAGGRRRPDGSCAGRRARRRTRSLARVRRPWRRRGRCGRRSRGRAGPRTHRARRATNDDSRLVGRTVSRRGSGGPWPSRERCVVGVAVGRDVAGDPASRRPDDRLIRVGDDDRIAASQADAGLAVPGDLHRPDSGTCRPPGDCVKRPSDSRRRRRASLEAKKRPGAPAQSAPPVGGREDGTSRVRSEEDTRGRCSDAAHQAIKKRQRAQRSRRRSPAGPVRSRADAPAIPPPPAASPSP